jgi:hypothetical protein
VDDVGVCLLEEPRSLSGSCIGKLKDNRLPFLAANDKGRVWPRLGFGGGDIFPLLSMVATPMLSAGAE